MWCWNFSRKTQTGFYPTLLTQWKRTDHCVCSIGPTQLWQATSQELIQYTEQTTVDAQQALPDCHHIPVHEDSGAQCHMALTSGRIWSSYLYYLTSDTAFLTSSSMVTWFSIYRQLTAWKNWMTVWCPLELTINAPVWNKRDHCPDTMNKQDDFSSFFWRKRGTQEALRIA